MLLKVMMHTQWDYYHGYVPVGKHIMAMMGSYQHMPEAANRSISLSYTQSFT